MVVFRADRSSRFLSGIEARDTRTSSIQATTAVSPRNLERARNSAAKVTKGGRRLDAQSAQVREGQAQIFGVCPQSEISQFAAEKLSQTLARVNGYRLKA